MESDLPRSADLTGKTVVVAGGAGTAGGAIVESLLRHGAAVAVPSRSDRRLAALADELGSARLHTFVGDLGDPVDATRVRDEMLDRLGAIDGAVAALGAWYEGEELLDLPIDTWQRLMRDNLTSHFLAAQTLLPVLRGRPGAVYVTLNGIAGVKAVPRSGAISVTGAGQAMLLRVLAAEVADSVRLHQVSVFTPIVTKHWDGGETKPEWLTGAQVGDYVANLFAAQGSEPPELFLAIPPMDEGL